ncbi:MAG: electron transfer flavoprotein subunit beta/FixA family protein [Kiritimatiellia bacterium]
MHIVVCIKQVPETGNVRINPETHTLMREGVAAIVNPFDMFAVEEGLRLKAKIGGRVTVITMGPPQAEAAVRETIAMGADDAVLICDRAFAGSDTWATSYTLAKAVQKFGDVSLVLCGKQAIDGDTAQVGPGIAAHLDLPQITYVRKIETIEENRIVAERSLENGFETIESSLPCVLTVTKEINEPRIPSLKGKMAAKKAVIPVWKADDLGCDPHRIGLEGSPTRVSKVFAPPTRQGGEIFTGDPDVTVPKLIEKLKEALQQASR